VDNFSSYEIDVEDRSSEDTTNVKFLKSELVFEIEKIDEEGWVRVVSFDRESGLVDSSHLHSPKNAAWDLRMTPRDLGALLRGRAAVNEKKAQEGEKQGDDSNEGDEEEQQETRCTDGKYPLNENEGSEGQHAQKKPKSSLKE
jgi:hypothetical protein